jgi:hypothetical protein
VIDRRKHGVAGYQRSLYDPGDRVHALITAERRRSVMLLANTPRGPCGASML